MSPARGEVCSPACVCEVWVQVRCVSAPPPPSNLDDTSGLRQRKEPQAGENNTSTPFLRKQRCLETSAFNRFLFLLTLATCHRLWAGRTPRP